jgi:hypothetical protein
MSYTEITVVPFFDNAKDFTIRVPISATLGDIRAAIQERIGGRTLDRVWTTLCPQNILFHFDAKHRECDDLPVHEYIPSGMPLSVGVFRYSTAQPDIVRPWWAGLVSAVQEHALVLFPYAMVWLSLQ